MQRPLWTAAALAALLAVAGCDPQDSSVGFGGGLDSSSSLARRSSGGSAPVSGGGGTPLPSLQNEDPTGLSKAPKGSGPESDETLAAQSAAYFDGSKVSGALGATPVAAGSREAWRSSAKLKPNAQSRTVKLDAGSVPSPGTLPKVDLPAVDPAQLSAGAKGGGPVLQAFESFERAYFDDVAPVFSRKAWGARSAKFAGIAQAPTRVTVHHTDGKQTFDEKETLAAVRNIQAFHMGPERGWDDIGYHFLIDGAGRVVEGRHTDVMGAHAQGANENNIGIALIGDYNRDKPTAAQIESLRRLVSFLAVKYRSDPRQPGFLQPHRHYNNTDCPGKNVVAILEQLRQEVDGDTADLVARLKGPSGRGGFQPLFVTQPSNA